MMEGEGLVVLLLPTALFKTLNCQRYRNDFLDMRTKFIGKVATFCPYGFSTYGSITLSLHFAPFNGAFISETKRL